MLFSDIVPPSTTTEYIQYVVKHQCSQYMAESGGLPLFKALPSDYDDFRRVKVRFQKTRDVTSEAFKQAFANEDPVGFKERAVLATGNRSLLLPENTSLFYVFPTDGFKYIFSPTVTNSEQDFNGVINTMLEQFDREESTALITDLLKYSYQQTNLHEGIQSNSEIIVHNISSFFVVRASLYPNYKLLIS